MKQKRVFLLLVLVLLFSLFLFSFVNAQQSEEEKVEKAYNWLITQVHGNWNNLNTKQNVFSLLALQCNSTFFEKGNDSLYEKSVLVQGKRCWGTGDVSSQGQCKLTETALAKIALDEFGYETDEIAQWIIGRNKTFLDIHWYLQIDIEQGQQANCSIIYQGVEEEGYRVWEDKSVAIVGSSRCFTPAGYWFKVKQTEECYNSQYTVKCWSGSSYYIVSWLYKKSPTSNIFYVSEETQSASPGYGNVEPDSIDTKLTSYCLTSPSDSANCDYEGTGWASYALARQGYTSDANVYIPYLIVAQESNIRYFPSTFLYQLMGTAMYETKIRNEQKTGGYWLIQPIIYGRNYDTAHAAMALGVGDEASQNAKTWLLQTQSTIGFWDSQDPGKERIRDTSYLLWIFWPDLCPTGEEEPPEPPPGEEDCEDQGPLFTCRDTCEIDEIIVPLFNCTGTDICCKQVGGGPVGDECNLEGGSCRDDCYGDEFELLGIDCDGTDICCKPYIDLTCNEVGGEFCISGEMCDPPSSEVETADSLPLSMCCLGDCITGQTCAAQNGYICDPNQGQYCQVGYELPATDTQYCCEQGYCQSASMMSCYDLGGELCYGGEVCLDYYDNIKSFVTANDGDCCIDGTCVEEQYCADINGKECFYPEFCYEGIWERTLDVDECCTSRCVAYCVDLGGVYCDTGEDCDGGSFTESYEGSACCINGTCSETGAGGFPWWIFIIIVIVAGGVAAYFLYFKKPRKPKAKGFPFGPRPGGKLPIIAKRPLMRPGRPGMPQRQRPMMARPRPGIPQRPPVLKKPGVMMPSIPRPAEKKPVGAPPHIMKKIGKPFPLISRPTVPEKPKIKPKRRAKSKTDTELEKTLKKLRKMTKSKAKKAGKARKKK